MKMEFLQLIVYATVTLISRCTYLSNYRKNSFWNAGQLEKSLSLPYRLFQTVTNKKS